MNYGTLATKEAIEKAVTALKERGTEAVMVENRGEALEKVKALIPPGASVMNGSSRTLEEIGFVEHLKSGRHGWKNLHEDVLAEKDSARQAILRKQAVLSDYYVGSVHAIARNGAMALTRQRAHFGALIASLQRVLEDAAQRRESNLASVLQRLAMIDKVLEIVNQPPSA